MDILTTQMIQTLFEINGKLNFLQIWDSEAS